MRFRAPGCPAPAGDPIPPSETLESAYPSQRNYSPYAAQLIAKAIHDKYSEAGWVGGDKSSQKFVIGDERTITVDGPTGKAEIQ